MLLIFQPVRITSRDTPGFLLVKRVNTSLYVIGYITYKTTIQSLTCNMYNDVILLIQSQTITSHTPLIILKLAVSVAMAGVCKGCALVPHSIIIDTTQNNSAALKIFSEHGCLPTSVICTNCGHECYYYNQEQRNEWRCPNYWFINKTTTRRDCGFTTSHNKGTFLHHVHLEPWQVIGFINLWLNKNFQHWEPVMNLGITKKTSVDWRSFCCEVTSAWFEEQNPVGGLNVVVEIDETFIVKAKFHVGRELAKKQYWLFGGIERESGKRFVVPLIDENFDPLPRSRDVLIPLIQKYILPGSIIYSDCWSSYNKISDYGYVHGTVNHKLKFINPENTEIHTQTVERLWRDVKEYIKKPGIRPHFFKQYLARYLFIKSYSRRRAFHYFLVEAAKLYPPQSDTPPPHPTDSDLDSPDSYFDESEDFDGPTPSDVHPSHPHPSAASTSSLSRKRPRPDSLQSSPMPSTSTSSATQAGRPPRARRGRPSRRRRRCTSPPPTPSTSSQ